MSAASALARGQALAESLMVDACTIRRRATGAATDDNSGAVTPAWTSLYTGKCRVQQAAASASPETPGQDYQLLVRLEVQLPVAVDGLAVADEITITASVHDPDLVGQVFLVRELFAKTHPTSRRVGVTRRTS